MSQKAWIWIGMSVGSFIAGLIPSLWGETMFSFTGLIFNALGGILGIWGGYKISRYLS